MDESRPPRAGWAAWAAAATVVVAILGPLAWPGYSLSYDMVFVPAQHLTWNLIAPADALPRAVPLDAVVASINLAIPGWLLQRLALAGMIVAAALGAARIVPTRRTSIRVLTAVTYAWTPYLAERLLIGHWALLCAYAALPWLVGAAIELRRDGPGRGPIARLVVASAAASLTPTGGILTFVTVAVLLLGSVPRRLSGLCLGAVVALNLPWLVATALSRAGSESDPAGVAAFAARAENWSGVVGALAGTGGAWNRLTMPGSRAWAVIPFVTMTVLALAGFGWPRLRRLWPAGIAVRLTALALGGFLLALAGATAPGAAALRFLVVHVPGAGLLRDGQKFLLPYVLVLVLAAACGAQRLAERVGREPGRIVIVGALILPVLALPDLGWGGGGALRPVTYPDDWAVVARVIDDAGAGAPGEVIVLPFAEYRRFAWNHGRVVIDPTPRYLAAPVVSDDALIVDGRVIEGEDRRAATFRARLAAGEPAAALGPEWVVVMGSVPASALTGLELAHQGPDLTLYRNPVGTAPPPASLGRRLTFTAAYLVALAVAVGALGSLALGRLRRRNGPRLRSE